jgi:DNA-binding NarL/FixJ family response regulator
VSLSTGVLVDAPASVSSVVIFTPHEIVAVGLRCMLTAPLDDGPPLRLLPADTAEEPDVVLYDVIGLLDGDGADLVHWVTRTEATVVALTRPLRPDLGTRALQRGAEAVLPLSATSAEVRAVVHDALAGRLAEQNGAEAGLYHRELGATVGLSPRELDVLRGVVNGLSNHEIADLFHLSINSVKTYIRNAYRKAGVTTRSQAVAWCVRHGFPPPPS